MSILKILKRFDSKNRRSEGEMRQIKSLRSQSERNQTLEDYLNRVKV